ncbi:MAG TPA: hypothetical protein VGS12_16060 [Caulobacteraceae bacterium]|nr:hypothetical protein [Caulobacteraceae bacterium]
MRFSGARTAMGLAAAAALAATAFGLGGCVNPIRMNPDFGEAVGQDTVAQVADPDARYSGPIRTSGKRVAGAESRYEKDQVIQPSSTGAANEVVGGTAPAGAEAGAGASMGAGPTPQ